MPEVITAVSIGTFILIAFGFAFSRFYRKVGPEEAIIKSGYGGLKGATGSGCWVIPILHRAEMMDLSVKRIEITRRAEAGLICRDNIRADIEVAFFVRVNNTTEDILNVAQSLGCRRASERDALIELFDAKFSEALKTVGKRFDFVELYNERDKFKDEILKVIGTDLNGYVLDDCAIDYLEQTPLNLLDPSNILDAEGIKKITDLTAREHVLANNITREKEKIIKKQDVEAAEAIMVLERQRVEAEQKQMREIAEVTAREQAQAAKVQEQSRWESESARITTEEEVQVAEENMRRQIVVAQKNRERTEAVETERVTKDRDLEATERTRVVGLAEIDKEKAIETEKRNIQEVIRERVAMERAVVEEQQRVMDTEEFAVAERNKKVKVTVAEADAQEALVKEVKAAEAERTAAEQKALQVEVEAEAQRVAAEKETQATKMLAEAARAEQAAPGLAEVEVMEARAVAIEKEGTAEADVMSRKYHAEASGIEEKAAAMKKFNDVGRDHEEFKLRLNKDKEIELAGIGAQEKIAKSQAEIVGQALETARIDIVGGETEFFDKIIDSIKSGKSVDRLVHNSRVLSDIKSTFFDGDPDEFRDRLQNFTSQFGMSFEDIKDLSVTALIGQMLAQSQDEGTNFDLRRLLQTARETGVGNKTAAALGLGLAATVSADES